MKTLLILLVLTVGVQSAQASMLCSVKEGRLWYPRLKSMPISDKAMHCTLSCHLAIRCSAIESWSFGRFKEFWDIFGEGNAEWADLRADDKGLEIARRGKVKKIGDCLRECRKLY